MFAEMGIGEEGDYLTEAWLGIDEGIKKLDESKLKDIGKETNEEKKDATLQAVRNHLISYAWKHMRALHYSALHPKEDAPQFVSLTEWEWDNYTEDYNDETIVPCPSYQVDRTPYDLLDETDSTQQSPEAIIDNLLKATGTKDYKTLLLSDHLSANRRKQKSRIIAKIKKYINSNKSISSYEEI